VCAGGTNQSVSLEAIRMARTLVLMAQNRPGTAFAIAAFATGMLVWFINPPSLDGAGGLASLVVGVAAFVYVAAWVTVLLIGRDAMPEEDFERIVERSEELARHPVAPHDRTEFEQIVADAIDRLPPDFQVLLEDTPVIVSSRGAESHAYGHYFGDSVAGGRYERRIVIYQDTLVRDFGWDPDVLAAQVERTLRHEVAHHLGWNESGVRGLGL
jgi:predicted Zn-dependent protease with MMP-like domain